MIPFSLVEITPRKEERRKEEPSFPFGFLTKAGPSTSSFLIANPMSSGTVKDVTGRLDEQGEYPFTSPYTAIFIYRPISDTLSRDFIKAYGGKLHNLTQAAISILTYFDEDDVKRWVNVVAPVSRPTEEQVAYNASKAEQSMGVFCEQFGLKEETLPSIVLIKKKASKNEYAVVSCAGLKDIDGIYQTFKRVIETTTDHYNEPFERIKNLLENGEKLNKYARSAKISEYIQSLYKRHGLTQAAFAERLGMDARTVRNKCACDPYRFSRDECVIIALTFRIPLEELNDLLEWNDYSPLGYSSRDLLLREGLMDRRSLKYIEESLSRNHQTSLFSTKNKKTME